MSAGLRVGYNGRCLEVDPSASLSIGRDPTADVVLSHTHVSGRHGRLHNDGTAWIYTDTGSRNGTWIGSRRLIAPEPIRGRIVLSLGAPDNNVPLELAPLGQGRHTPPVPESRPERASAEPAKVFNTATPWLLVIAPSVLTGLFGEALKPFLAPGLTSGDLSGVIMATFVLSSATAIVTAIFKLFGMVGGWWGSIGLVAVALLITNTTAAWLGLGSLDYWNDYITPGGGPPQFRFILAFLAAGFKAYGVLGTALGITAGCIAGLRFAKWYQHRYRTTT